MSQLHTARSDIWTRINQMNVQQKQQQQQKEQRELQRQFKEQQQQKQQSHLQQGAHSSSRAGFSQIVHSGMSSFVDDIAGTPSQAQRQPPSTPRAPPASRPSGVIAARTRSMSTDKEAEPDTTEPPSSAARRALGIVKKKTKKQPRN